ncbi:RNA polymerase subunit sigma-70, partial [Rhizobium sp. CRIBSB]|nr:RNA polymerase subunit sigma-70 [Rhizobium sp. CRIBSB]
MGVSLKDRHDVELAALAAAGGRAEFGELVRRHSSAVRGLLRRMGAQPSVADDVAQDAFIQAFQRCAEFRGEGTFAAWIRRIAARLYLKRRAREARYVDEA